MDAVKFLKERNRMCKVYSQCDDCPIKQEILCCCEYAEGDEFEEMVKIVENWNKENPEELGKKYIIEIAEVADNGFSYRIKGADCWLDRKEIAKLEEYKESEE